MSRLIIKNLPSYVTPARLQEHFEGKKTASGGPGGTLTDVKVALKPDGTSRRFGFVGFKTDAEAAAAKEWYDQTFIDSTRINVKVVEGIKDAPAPRPNKRPRLGPSPTDELTSTTSKKTSKADAKTDKPVKGKGKVAQLDEYLEVMQPRAKKGPSWANEAQAHPDLAAPDTTPKLNDKTAGDDEKPKEEEREEGISDLDWMRRRMTQTVDSVDTVPEKAFEQSDDEMDDASKPAEISVEPEPPQDPTKETILQTSRLFMRNLAFSCTDADLLELCQPFGEISQVRIDFKIHQEMKNFIGTSDPAGMLILQGKPIVHIPLDSISKKPKGVAYVTFAKPTCALAAYEALDRRSFQGRLLHVLAAVDRKGKIQVEEGEGKKKTVKDEKESKRKAMAGRDFNWSMLYMNSDAVASSIADRMNIPKSDILNPETDNAAVKLALAETHIIQETKTYLESQGVLLASFSSRARSETVILVKNIPYGTTAEQIREMFETHGELVRVLVPPAGTMGVVEFVHADEAAKAFRAVAYRRLGNAVIYLEKGPVGMFEDDGDKASTRTVNGVKPVTISEQAEGDDADEPALSAGATLFVKNLSFSTTTDRLTQVFRNLPDFSFARVQTKPDPKRPGADAPRLSMGYGFVGFKKPEGAKKAIKSMQGFTLDGHSLHVKFAGRGAEEVDDKGKDKTGAKSRTTKMIVKNVPFEATKKDIRELFGAHGHLKSVRLPKKFHSGSRGFAFLDFVTRHEAENAYAALRHTHLLGRHLVLEWAEEAEQDLELLRQKAGVGFGGGAEMPGKKRKLEIGMDNGEGVGDEDMS